MMTIDEILADDRNNPPATHSLPWEETARRRHRRRGTEAALGIRHEGLSAHGADLLLLCRLDRELSPRAVLWAYRHVW